MQKIDMDFIHMNPAEKRQAILDYLKAHPNSTYRELCDGLGVDNQYMGVSVVLQKMRNRKEADRTLVTGKREYSRWFALVEKTTDMHRKVYKTQNAVNNQRQAEIERQEAEQLFRATRPKGARLIRLGDRPCYKNQGGQGCAPITRGKSAILGE